MAAQKIKDIGQLLFGKMVEFKMAPQTVANGILKLITLPRGTHPLRFPLDAIAQETDAEFSSARSALKAKWLLAY